MPARPPEPVAILSEAERTYHLRAPHLWPWTGWYALVTAERLVGVFPTLWSAVVAAQATGGDADAVLIRRIGEESAVPVPSADGGLVRQLPSWSH